jgi:CTP:molybdopterin cytidylyltransferase MocA
VAIERRDLERAALRSHWACDRQPAPGLVQTAKGGLAFARSTFAALTALDGDRGVWKLLDRYGEQVADVEIDGPIPRDIDTWEAYEAVRGSAGPHPRA